MRSPRMRAAAGVAVVSTLMVLGACTDDPGSDGGGEVPGSEPTGDPVALRYAYEPGDELVYDVELSQSLILETSGSATAVAEEELPGSADVTISASGVFTYRVEEGPDDGTLAVSIDGEFDQVSAEGTADGAPVEDVEDVDQFGLTTPVSRTVVVDRRGRIVPDTTTGPDPLGFGSLPLAGLAGDLGRVVGPVLSEGEVRPGETWTETSRRAAFGDETVETTLTASVSGTDQVEGEEVVVVDATTETGPLVVDLSEFFAEFMGAFDDTGDAAAEMEEIEFRIEVEPSTSESSTAIDPDRGVAVRSTLEGPSSLTMEVALPGESGDLERFDVSLRVDQTTTYTLR